MDLHSADRSHIERIAALHPDAPVVASNHLIAAAVEGGAPYPANVATRVSALKRGCDAAPDGSQALPARDLLELIDLAMLRRAQRAHDALLERAATAPPAP